MLHQIKRNVVAVILLLCSCADYELLNLGDPEPVNLSIVAATDTTVSLCWSKSTDDGFKNYKVFYSRKETVDQKDSLVDSLSFRVDTVRTIRNLTPATHYYFRVMVNTTRNLFSPSNEVDTITLKDTTSDTIYHIKLFAPGSITSSSVTLRWSKYNGFFDSYRIFGDSTWDVNSKDSLFATVYQDTAIVLSGLPEGSKYWFRVYAKKDTSYLAESNSIEVTIP
jgi:hypothetical protein